MMLIKTPTVAFSSVFTSVYVFTYFSFSLNNFCYDCNQHSMKIVYTEECVMAVLQESIMDFLDENHVCD